MYAYEMEKGGQIGQEGREKGGSEAGRETRAQAEEGERGGGSRKVKETLACRDLIEPAILLVTEPSTHAGPVRDIVDKTGQLPVQISQGCYHNATNHPRKISSY